MRRNKRGTCFIEMSMAGLVTVILCLAFLDLMSIVLAEEANDQLAHNAARCAADQTTAAAARDAAQQAIGNCALNSVITSIKLTKFDYNQSQLQVSLSTDMTVHLPAPVPFFEQCHLLSCDTEPIVGISPETE